MFRRKWKAILKSWKIIKIQEAQYRTIQLDDEAYDGISKIENEKLYDCLVNKLNKSIFSKMPGCQKEVVQAGRQKFTELMLEKQITVLMAIINLFEVRWSRRR